MQTVILVAPAYNGHHATYTSAFASAVLGYGHRVVVITPEAAQLRAWFDARQLQASERLLVRELDPIQGRRVPGIFQAWVNKTQWVRAVAAQIRAGGIEPDFVFHTWLDNCLTPGLSALQTDFFFPYPWSGLYFHPWYLREPVPYAQVRRGMLANHAALLSRRCPAVAVLDEGIADKLQAYIQKPVLVFPDVADDALPDAAYPPAQEVRSRAKGRTVVALLGVLDRRKGLLTLLDLARRAPPDRWFFVCAGPLFSGSFSHSEQQVIVDFLAECPENCFFFPQSIPDGPSFNAMVAACDILFAVYEHFLSSSNLLTKAAIFEKPIVVSERYCMGERVIRYGIGRTTPESNPEAVLSALEEITALVQRHGSLPDADFRGYRAAHAPHQLEARFGELLQLAGIKPS